jgi:hypothetical protein
VSWKVADVKRYILSKVSTEEEASQFSFPSRRRPVSPIIFASNLPRRPLDPLADVSVGVGSDVDADTLAFGISGHVRPKPLPNSTLAPSYTSTGNPSLSGPALSTSHYALIEFSTGQLLEDDYSLAWYCLRPNVLLELHPPGIVVNLNRDNELEYSQPYFETKIKALRVTMGDQSAMDKDLDPDRKTAPGRHKADTPTKKGKEKEVQDTVSSLDRPPSTKKRKKTRLEWKERWLIIHHGTMNVHKDRFVSVLHFDLGIVALMPTMLRDRTLIQYTRHTCLRSSSFATERTYFMELWVRYPVCMWYV